MEAIRLWAHAKINLSLDVKRKRADGYHEVRMVMQSLGLCDGIDLEIAPEKEGVTLSPCGAADPAVPYDGRNLMCRAAELMRESFGIREGVRLRLEKHIPAAAGLAGGSSDAAAVILGINELFELHADKEMLRKLGLRIGADVPYCMTGGTALSEGIGEILTPLPAAPPCRVLLVKPQRGVSTREVYEALAIGTRSREAHPDIDAVLEALENKSLRELAAHMGNILELVTVPMVPEVGQIREAMLRMGALGAMMSGSGPTVFGLFTDEGILSAAAEAFRSGPYRALCRDVIETEFYRVTAL